MELSKPAIYQVKVVEKKNLTEKYLEVWLEKPAGVEYEAGQYLSVKVNAEGVRRSYSLISTPEEANLGLLIDTGPGGLGSQFFLKARSGEIIEILMPMGRFVVRKESGRKAMFVATGSGIAPMRGMIKELLESGSERQVRLVWGMRHEEDLFWMDEWRGLAEAHKNFSWEVVLSQPSEGWKGVKGHVGELLRGDWSGWEAYVCGGNDMVRATRDEMIIGKMEAEAVYFEKFN